MNLKPEIGEIVLIRKSELQGIFDCLSKEGFEVVGPRVEEGAIVYAPIDSIGQLPVGVLDEQEGGRYLLKQTDANSFFDYVVGPHSLKNYLFPACQTISQSHRVEAEWKIESADGEAKPVAVIGVRACDLHALRIQDRVFLEGAYVDDSYRSRRERLFVVAINCRRAAETCFCHSLQTGPEVSDGFDLALTEFEDHFSIEVGSASGAEVMSQVDWTPCTDAEKEAARAVPERLRKTMCEQTNSENPSRRRSLDTDGLQDVLMNNLVHPQWEDVGERCISCGNCTMVCPTCFCSSVDEVSDLTGDDVSRVRRWDSCFNADHSRINSGVVRQSTAARYRQWLTHKLATWVDQFDEIGCVGCGRCITWCPVAIDLTAEVASIRENSE